MRVLVVEDDEAYLQLLTLILEDRQYDIIKTRDGKSAWDLMLQNPFQFIITDWMLPEMDGLDLIRHIRAANFPNYTYIILLTAKHSKSDVVDGLESGADDFLTKPFDPNEFRARIGIGERILKLETQLREANERLYLLATRDSLTNLLNRRALYDVGEKEIARAEREHTPISLLMVDIDHFKSVNDKYGHLVGDRALCWVAQTISSNKRSYDQIGRWGGEEFLLILPGTGTKEAHQIAERLRLAIVGSGLDLPGGKILHLQASFGVASMEKGTSVSFVKLVQHADEALYRAKEGGRNQVCSFGISN